MRYYFLLALAILLGSCANGDCNNGVQDGNETGIDCGGGCEECFDSEKVFKKAPILRKMQGKWFSNITITKIYLEPFTGCTVSNGSIFFSSCPVEFTTNNPSISSLTGGEFSAELLGDLISSDNDCSYPKVSKYMYNFASKSFVLPKGTHFEMVEGDEGELLVAKSSTESVSWKNYLQRTVEDYSSDFNEVYWEVEIIDQKLLNGTVEFIIQEEFNKGSESTFQITKNQTKYMDKYGLEGKEPWITLKAKATSKKTSGHIRFNARLIMNGEVISECLNGYFCLNQANCIGEELTTDESQVIDLNINLRM